MVWAINNMGGHTAVLGKGPESFNFSANKAIISARDGDETQRIIDYFKQWLPRFAIVYEKRLEQDIENEKRERTKIMEQKIQEEEKKSSLP